MDLDSNAINTKTGRETYYIKSVIRPVMSVTVFRVLNNTLLFK